MKTKETKTVQHNTSLLKSANVTRDKDNAKSPWLEDYLNCFSFKLQPVTKAFIEKLAKELIEWAKNNDDALRIADFYWSKGIPDSTYYKWSKEHEILALAHKAALNFIASRREIGALKKKYSETLVMRRQHAYDQEWTESDKYHNQLKIDATKAAIQTAEIQTPIKVVFKNFISDEERDQELIEFLKRNPDYNKELKA